MGRGRKAINMIGMKVGKLTVIDEAETVVRDGSTTKRWYCECECGGSTIATTSDLRSGHTRSCGCYKRQRTGDATRIHGMRHTKIYHTWLDIKNRCHNYRNKSYKNYGARGIAVCDEWRNSFISFYQYVSTLPNFGVDGYSIDRIDNDGNYEPGNVRWASARTQSMNKRNTIHVSVLGKTTTILDLADETGIKYATLLFHQKRGDLEKYVISKGGNNGITDQRIQAAGGDPV